MTKLPLTALVSSHNQAHLLDRCLASVGVCDEIVVIDVASEDTTAGVAEARHDWLLVVDPDDEAPDALAEEVAHVLPTLPADVAALDAPRQHYFCGRPLRGTVWGGPNKRRLLVRRSGVELTPTIWGGMRIRPGFRVVSLPFTGETAIVHRWATGYGEFLARHRRYLRLEPVDCAEQGEVTGLGAALTTPWTSFQERFFAQKGYRDGTTGLELSAFGTGFRTAGEVALYRRPRATARGRTS